MSNKSQLQTNNTNLDNYIARINVAKEVAANLPEAGSSSGSGSYEIGTFYLEGRMVGHSDYAGISSAVAHPFIVGQTWGEWVNSPLNIDVYYSTTGITTVSQEGDSLNYNSAGGIMAHISTDGTQSGCVTPSDVIQSMSYSSYFSNTGGF